MLNQAVPLEENFRSFTSNRSKTRSGFRCFNWRNSLEKRYAKIVIGLCGDDKAGQAVENNRKFTASGAGDVALYERLVHFCPWILDLHKSETGRELKPNVVGCRYKMMWTVNKKTGKKSRAVRSTEHYQAAEYLRPYVSYVSAHLLKGRPVPLDRILREMAAIKPL